MPDLQQNIDNLRQLHKHPALLARALEDPREDPALPAAERAKRPSERLAAAAIDPRGRAQLRPDSDGLL